MNSHQNICGNHLKHKNSLANGLSLPIAHNMSMQIFLIPKEMEIMVWKDIMEMSEIELFQMTLSIWNYYAINK